MRTLKLLSGRLMPVLGQGTWGMGEIAGQRKTEIEALRLGIDLGMTMIDTAEMYGDGAAEELIGEAISDRRKNVYLVSKVLPHHATMQGVIDACNASLKRLKTDYLDLYLLHWRGNVPLEITIEGFIFLKKEGKILDFGVSNFDLDDMHEAFHFPGGKEIVTDQVLYNLVHRGIEVDLLPWCRVRGMPIMAYSPLGNSPSDQRKIFENPHVKLIAAEHNATPAQIALAWLLHQEEVAAIPKASKPKHVQENRKALDISLTPKDLVQLDKSFPRPKTKVPLEMI